MNKLFEKKQEKKKIIIHYGELLLKSGNRRWFEDKLVNNVRAKLGNLNLGRIEKLGGRIIIDVDGEYPSKALSDKLSKVFGLAVFTEAYLTRPNLADIGKTVLSCLSRRSFKTFAVRCKRLDKKLPFRSLHINEEIGGVVLDNVEGAKVNLSFPEQTIWIDLFTDVGYVYFDKVLGAGGLPTGVSGKVGCLISGGIDSPVAAWRMMKRGCEVVLIHFHSAPFTDKASIEKVEELTEILAGWYPGKIKLALVPLGAIQKKIVTQTEEKYRVILYRRFMVRMAEAIARNEGCEALVTGEALGQVASQTLSNIGTVDSVTTMPIFRPLIGFDKQEVIDQAKFIGTYDLSIQPHQDCCQFFEPRHPVTRTTNEELTQIEKVLNIDELVKEGLTGMEWKFIEDGTRKS